VHEALYHQFNPNEDEKNRDGKNDWIEVQVESFSFAPKFSQMILKITKALWFFSLLISLFVLLYVYASLQETVMIMEGENPISLSRDGIFYLALGCMAVMNLFAFIINKLYSDAYADFKSWFYTLIVTLNIFFIIGLNFVSLMNSGEKFDYSRLGIFIYGSVGLIVLWAIAWPAYSLSRKIFVKQ
jgi:hypothetical protein